MIDDDIEGIVVIESLPFYRRVAHSMCQKHHMQDHYDDLCSIAATALLGCLRAFDPAKNQNFEKSSYLRVRGAMVDYLRKIGRKSRYSGDWTQVVSLDAPLAEDGITLGETLRAPERIGELDGYWLPGDWMSALEDRQAYVLLRRYWGSATQAEIGRELGIAESRVSQIHAAALKNLRSIL